MEPHPLQQLQQAVCSVSSQVASSLAGVQHHCQQQLAPLQGRVTRLLSGLQQQIPMQQQQQHASSSRRAFPRVRRAHEHQLHGCWQPMVAVSSSFACASSWRRHTQHAIDGCFCVCLGVPSPPPPTRSTQTISMGSSGPSGSGRPQPVMDLAMAKDEVKARLAPIPVFTVANPKNEFVLVAGEVRVGGVAICVNVGVPGVPSAALCALPSPAIRRRRRCRRCALTPPQNKPPTEQHAARLLLLPQRGRRGYH